MPRRFSDLAITTSLMMNRIFSMPLIAQQGFLDSVFKLANIPLVCPHYTVISRRAKDVEVSFKTKIRGATRFLFSFLSRLTHLSIGDLTPMAFTAIIPQPISELKQCDPVIVYSC